MTEAVNTYISFKQVKTLPSSGGYSHLADGHTSEGTQFVVGVQDGDRPAMYFFMRPTDADEREKPITYRCDLTRLVKGLIGAVGAHDEEWTPLLPEDHGDSEERYSNNQVMVHVTRREGHIQISYHRHDRAPIRDWRVGQRLKNEICGPEFEGVEIYPAESRLVDTSNEYHMFVVEEIPFGFNQRDVATQDICDSSVSGAVQRDDPLIDVSSIPTHPELTGYDVRVPKRSPGDRNEGDDDRSGT